MGHQMAGRFPQAETLYQGILKADPHRPDVLLLLGMLSHQMGENDTAVDLIARSLVLKPDSAQAHNNLGVALKELGRLDEAVESFGKALVLKADYAEAHNNLGAALQDLGALDEAVESYHKALALKPDDATAHYNLGTALQGLGELDQAVASFGKALAIKPDYATAHNNLGTALKEQRKLAEAAESFRKALAFDPDDANAHYNLGITLQDQGDIDEAAKRIDLALSMEPEKDGWRIRRALLLPIIPTSQEDIQNRYDALTMAVASLLKQDLKLDSPVNEVGYANFFLAYHNQNNRKIQEDIARLYIGACPSLTFEAKHCRSENRGEKDVLRMGFLSSHFREHTIGKLSRGIIQQFSRDRFEVIVLRPPGKKDHISKIIDEAADKVVSLSGKLERDRKIIEEEELDVLFYLDIGMDPYTYFLSFARLAPVQAVTWGHPDSTGIPNMDYFISSERLEIADCADHYKEQVVRLPHVPTYYFRPESPQQEFTRKDFGLPDENRLYVCPQSLFKFHPQFDTVLGDLLRRDPDGRLVLIGDDRKGLLFERFKGAFADVAEHVIFIPQMSYEKYLGLLRVADALLDIPNFSGGNSSLEAFAMGAPIVTWPQEFMRGRVTAAFYRQMDLNELIATDAESYLTLALRLAQDADFKRRMQAEIEAGSHKLYERHEAVRHMESFFRAAHDAWRNGETLPDGWGIT